MATLLAAVIAFGRMAHDRELLAFKGAGISVGRLTVPLVVVGVVLSLMLVAFNGSVLPEATAA
jgi:lipopolysaccharide export LptBFGC system permease protein LptF